MRGDNEQHDKSLGSNDFTWLKEQALDENTKKHISQIKEDEMRFYREKVVTPGSVPYELNFRQGKIWTTRGTAHSVANIFVQIFKNSEHTYLKDFLYDVKVLVDIGANEGYYTLKMLAENPLARAIVVEPNPIAAVLLKRNILSNHLSGRVTIIEGAVGERSGFVRLNTVNEVTSIGSVENLTGKHSWLGSERVVIREVPVFRLDEILDKNDVKCIDILKIDTEGSELQVLKSGEKFLSVIEKIVLEYHSNELSVQVSDFLEKRNFDKILQLSEGGGLGEIYFRKNHPFSRMQSSSKECATGAGGENRKKSGKREKFS